MNQKILLLVILVIGIGIVGVGYFAMLSMPSPSPSFTPSPTPTDTPTPPTKPTPTSTITPTPTPSTGPEPTATPAPLQTPLPTPEFLVNTTWIPQILGNLRDAPYPNVTNDHSYIISSQKIHLYQLGSSKVVVYGPDGDEFYHYLEDLLVQVNVATQVPTTHEYIAFVKTKNKIIELSYRVYDDFHLWENFDCALFVLDDHLDHGLTGNIFIRQVLDGVQTWSRWIITPIPIPPSPQRDYAWIHTMNTRLEEFKPFSPYPGEVPSIANTKILWFEDGQQYLIVETNMSHPFYDYLQDLLERVDTDLRGFISLTEIDRILATCTVLKLEEQDITDPQARLDTTLFVLDAPLGKEALKGTFFIHWWLGIRSYWGQWEIAIDPNPTP